MVSNSGMLEKTWNAIQREHTSFIIYALLLALPIFVYIFVRMYIVDVDPTTGEVLRTLKNVVIARLTQIGIPLFSLWVSGAVIYSSATSLTRQGHISIKQDLSQAGKKLLPLLVLSIVTSVMVTAGFFLLILPGFALVVLLAFVFHIYLLEETTIKQSISRSISTVKPIFWPLLGRFIVLSLFIGLIAMIVELITTGLFALISLNLLISITYTLVSAAVAIFTMTALTVLYLSRASQPSPPPAKAP